MDPLDLFQYVRQRRNFAFTRLVAGSFESCGNGTVLELPLRVHGREGVSLGRDVHVGSGSWLFTRAPGRLTIGDGCRLSGGCVLSAVASVTLGQRVLLGSNVYISDNEHGFEGVDAVMDQPLTQISPVTIGDGAWLAQNAVVLSGVSIGAGAVVGANAVVTHDVEPRVVVVGAPARAVRRL